MDGRRAGGDAGATGAAGLPRLGDVEQPSSERREEAVVLLETPQALLLLALLAFLADGAACPPDLQPLVAPLRRLAEDARLIATGNLGHRLDRLARRPGGARWRRASTCWPSASAAAPRCRDPHSRRRPRSRRRRGEHACRADAWKLTCRCAGVQPGRPHPAYNPRAPAAAGGRGAAERAGDWIDRPVFGILDAALDQARLEIEHRLAAGEQELLVPFVATRPGDGC
ncbi:MAG: hypothetical protein U1E33_04405 [Rhodospirillales bacterium]